MHRIAQGSLSLLRSRATRRRQWRSAVRTRPEYVPLSIDFGRRAALSVYISCVSAEMLFTMRIISEGVFESGAHYFGRNIGHVLILSLAFYAASFTQRAAASSIDELRRSRYLSSILGGQYLSQAMHHSQRHRLRSTSAMALLSRRSSTTLSAELFVEISQSSNET